jgi:hypothetical protein
MSHAHSSTTANLVGVHYRVGKKIGEGSFGVIFEGRPTAVHYGLTAAHLGFLLSRNQSAELADGGH